MVFYKVVYFTEFYRYGFFLSILLNYFTVLLVLDLFIYLLFGFMLLCNTMSDILMICIFINVYLLCSIPD